MISFTAILSIMEQLKNRLHAEHANKHYSKPHRRHMFCITLNKHKYHLRIFFQLTTSAKPQLFQDKTMVIEWDRIYMHQYMNYLWLMRVRSLEFLRLGNCNLSRNKGFASISFFSSTNMIALADLVSPYLESCSFSLFTAKQNLACLLCLLDTIESELDYFSTHLPKILQCQ